MAVRMTVTAESTEDTIVISDTTDYHVDGNKLTDMTTWWHFNPHRAKHPYEGNR